MNLTKEEELQKVLRQLELLKRAYELLKRAYELLKRAYELLKRAYEFLNWRAYEFLNWCAEKNSPSFHCCFYNFFGKEVLGQGIYRPLNSPSITR